MTTVAGVGLAVMLVLLALVTGRKWGVTAPWFRRAVISAPTLRGRLLIGMILIGLVPVMTLPPILLLDTARVRQAELGQQLRLDASALAHGITRSVRKHIADIDALGAHINSLQNVDSTSLRDWLLRHHTANPEFVSSWIARPDGEVVAATAFRDGDHEPWSGPLAGVSSMKFFPASVEHGGLYVSPVMKGVAPRRDPMMVISAPLFAAGTGPWGFLQAQLNLRRVSRNVVSFDSIPGRFLLLVDQKNRVMASFPEGGFTRFENLSGHTLIRSMEGTHGEAFSFEAEFESGESSGNHLAVRRDTENGWQVFAIASLSGTRNQALIFLGLSLLWGVFVTYLAMTLALFYGGIIGAPLKTLDHSLDVFDAQHTLKEVPMAPKDAPVEIARVFNRVRRSLEKSRDSYRNMLKAINEGDELRRKLRFSNRKEDSHAPAKDAPKSEPKPVAKGKKKATQLAAPAEYEGRWDSPTELSGNEVFQEFLTEAWALGCSDARPLALLLFSIGLEKARASDNKVQIDEAVFRATGEVLRRMVGRDLDLVARIGDDRYVLVLPDTDLYGALVVAERSREALEVIVRTGPGGKVLEANAAVASVVPALAGDGPAFLKVAQRLLAAAEQKSGSRLAYMDESLRLKMIAPGEPVPTDPRDGARASGTEPAGKPPPKKSRGPAPVLEPALEAQPAQSESSRYDFEEIELELEKTMALTRDPPEPEEHGLTPYTEAQEKEIELELEKTLVIKPNQSEP